LKFRTTAWGTHRDGRNRRLSVASVPERLKVRRSTIDAVREEKRYCNKVVIQI
jgi:hypothetical protein